jgi:hypothetical protein
MPYALMTIYFLSAGAEKVSITARGDKPSSHSIVRKDER